MIRKKREKRVIVFTSPHCPWCRKVKVHLKKNRIRFREIDVSKNHSAARDIVRKTGQQGTPVILVNNRPIVGFNKSKLNRMLDIRSH